MANGYWLVAYRSVSDEQKLADYKKIARPVVEAAGGRILANTDKVTPFESGLAELVVLIEFPSRQAALEAYQSDAYQRALEVLDGAADRDFRVLGELG